MLEQNKNLQQNKIPPHTIANQQQKSFSFSTLVDDFQQKFTQFQLYLDDSYNKFLQSDTYQNFFGQKNDSSQKKDDKKPTAAQKQAKVNKESVKSNDISNFQHASYFAASFLFVMAIASLSSFQTSRRSIWFAVGGMFLAIWATFYQSSWDLGDSFRWLCSFLIGACLGLYLGYKAKITQYAQTICFLQAAIGVACFLLGFAQFQRLSHFKAKFNSFDSFQNVLVCLLGSILFSSAITCYFKLDKHNIAKEPLNYIGKYRNKVNIGVIVAIAVFGLLYIWFSIGFALWVIIILSLYIGWGLVISAQQKEINVIIPCQTILTGFALSFVGFMLSRDYLIIVGALCITGGYALTCRACSAINCNILNILFKSWNRAQEQSVKSFLAEFGYNNQDISKSDLLQEMLNASKIIIVPGNGIYQSQSTKSTAQIALFLQTAGKTVHFCIHPATGKIPGHMNAILAEYEVPYYLMKELNEVEFQDYDLCIVIGAYEEVDPDNLCVETSLNYKSPTCQVWQSNRVIYVETKVEKNYVSGLFDKNNVFVLRGETQPNLSGIYKELSDKGPAQIQEDQMNNQGANKSSLNCQISEEQLQYLIKKCTKILGVLNESEKDKEKRVALTPEVAQQLIKNGINVWIEKDAGKQSGYSDEMYSQAGIKVTNSNEIYTSANILLYISELKNSQIDMFGKKLELVIAPLGQNKEQKIQKLTKFEQLSLIDLNNIPQEYAKGQKLSTKNNLLILQGQRSILEGFYHLNKTSRAIFNQAGKSQESKVLVIGADQIGLNAGMIAKQMYGAEVRIFDGRDCMKEIIKQAGFQCVEFVYEGENLNIQKIQNQALLKALENTDMVVIATAKNEGINLLNEEACGNLRRGAVIVDLQAENGGNCTYTQVDKVNFDQNSGIVVVGYSLNSYSQKFNRQASELHAMNINHLFNIIVGKKNQELDLNLNDELIQEICFVHKGKNVSERPIRRVQKELEQGPNENEIPAVHFEEKNEEKELNIDTKQNEEEQQLLSQQAQPTQQNTNQQFRPPAREEKTPKQQLQEGYKVVSNFLSEHLGEEQREKLKRNPGIYASLITFILLIICIILAVHTDSQFIVQLGIFILALFVGDTIVQQVHVGLYTPLLILLQTIGGSIGVACMIVFSYGDPVDLFESFSFIATVGNLFSVMVIIAGFTLSLRCVESFVPREQRQISEESEEY